MRKNSGKSGYPAKSTDGDEREVELADIRGQVSDVRFHQAWIDADSIRELPRLG